MKKEKFKIGDYIATSNGHFSFDPSVKD